MGMTLAGRTLPSPPLPPFHTSCSPLPGPHLESIDGVKDATIDQRCRGTCPKLHHRALTKLDHFGHRHASERTVVASTPCGTPPGLPQAGSSASRSRPSLRLRRSRRVIATCTGSSLCNPPLDQQQSGTEYRGLSARSRPVAGIGTATAGAALRRDVARQGHENFFPHGCCSARSDRSRDSQRGDLS